MSREELTPFSYVVLVLVGDGGAGPHDLVRMGRRGSVYSTAADSQYYAEPKRLERLGYLKSRKEPGLTRERTHYELTENGRRALRDWISQPTPYPRTDNQAIVRLLAADLVGEEAVLRSLQGMRDEIADLNARLDAAEAIARTLPHKEKYLLLNHRLARRLLKAHLDWLDELGDELAPKTAKRSPRAARGRSSVAPRRKSQR
jgi:PadR family transcriptional regulator, regulatory protein AphA